MKSWFTKFEDNTNGGNNFSYTTTLNIEERNERNGDITLNVALNTNDKNKPTFSSTTEKNLN